MKLHLPPHFCSIALAICLGTARAFAPSATGLGLDVSSGVPVLSVSAPTGTLCQVQFQNNLSSSNWIGLTSLALTSNPCLVPDAGAGGTTQRFYRAMGVSPNMTLVPGGSFAMGDSFSDLGADEVPVHSATVSGFYMDRLEVSKALWDIVYSWATNRGYDFSPNAGLAKAATHPVSYPSWYDSVKWCNARSELEGLIPCYYSDAAQTTVYRAGQITVSNSFVNWSATGYRLPTEAEWERAARGGAASMRFPWGDTNVISHTLANYYAGAAYPYDKSPTKGYHPAFTNGPAPYTSPCGYFAPNGFGLYDMAGNVWEWCWDWHDPYWYTNSAATLPDTPGPDSVSRSRRVRRGGSYASNAPDCCCALREGASPTSTAGFRCVKAAK